MGGARRGSDRGQQPMTHDTGASAVQQVYQSSAERSGAELIHGISNPQLCASRGTALTQTEIRREPVVAATDSLSGLGLKAMEQLYHTNSANHAAVSDADTDTEHLYVKVGGVFVPVLPSWDYSFTIIAEPDDVRVVGEYHCGQGGSYEYHSVDWYPVAGKEGR